MTNRDQTHPADRTNPTATDNANKDVNKDRPAFGGLDKDKEPSTDMSKKDREQAQRTQQPEAGRTSR